MEKTSKLNILMVVRYYWPHVGGNENQAKLLSNYLVREYPIEIVIVTSLYDRSLKKVEQHNNIRIVRLPHFTRKSKQAARTLIGKIINKLKFLLEEYSFLFNLYKFLKKEVPLVDLLHVHQTSWLSILPTYFGKKYQKPVLIKEATLNGFKFLKTIFLPPLLKRYPIKNSFFISVSTMILEDLLKQGVPKNRIFNISNGIKTNQVKTSEQKTDLSLTRNVLFIGNFSHGKIKGLDVLLKAIPLCKKKIPNIRLTIVGKGNKDDFSNLIRELNIEANIEFVGEKKNVDQYYTSNSIYVLPSRSEGMSNSLLEAMSHGLPCVSTKVSGAEDIIDDKINGFIVDIEDHVQLADRVTHLLENKKILHAFEIESKKKIQENFSITKIAEQYYNLYKELLTIYNDQN